MDYTKSYTDPDHTTDNLTHKNHDDNHRQTTKANSKSQGGTLLLVTTTILATNLAAILGLTLAVACLCRLVRTKTTQTSYIGHQTLDIQMRDVDLTEL